jgi:hypothetical protein
MGTPGFRGVAQVPVFGTWALGFALRAFRLLIAVY